LVKCFGECRKKWLRVLFLVLIHLWNKWCEKLVQFFHLKNSNYSYYFINTKREIMVKLYFLFCCYWTRIKDNGIIKLCIAGYFLK
jgi:hypothetical protein